MRRSRRVRAWKERSEAELRRVRRLQAAVDEDAADARDLALHAAAEAERKLGWAACPRSRLPAALLALAAALVVVRLTAAPTAPSAGSVKFVVEGLARRVLYKSRPPRLVVDGFRWAEGPLWLAEQQRLLFSDTVTNTMWSWSDTSGLAVVRKQAGCSTEEAALLKEPGSNGLALAANGEDIIVARHGRRDIARMSAEGDMQSLVSSHAGRRLNSPNDVAVHRASGSLLFTDPPYGLQGLPASAQQQPWSAVYRLAASGELFVEESGLSRPNGIVIAPCGTWALVSVSGRADDAGWWAYSVTPAGRLADKRRWAPSVSSAALSSGRAGSFDGLAMTADGQLVFATAPGGVLLLARSGRLLAVIDTAGRRASNVALGGRSLYITAEDALLRVRLRGA